MTQKISFNHGCLAVVLILNLFFVAHSRAQSSGKVDFNFQVRPLLSDRCFRCHGPDASSRKAKLRLDTREGALKTFADGSAIVKPGSADASELVRRLFTEDEDEIMPPPDSHLTLTSAEKDLLKRWVQEGAEYKPHWAFLPVQPVEPPVADKKDVWNNPIDNFIRARLQQEKLRPAAPASRETLIRRLALNLTGLPPTVAEVDAFLADKSSDAYEKIVTKYLASPAYGERMALDWLDLARYADTYGYQNDVERDVSPYRDWVIRAFNENLSYDRFLTWQIAGDLLPNATREQRIATAFNRLHRQTNEGGSIDEEFRTEYAADRINTVGTAILGLTMECARCHDHKFDPIRQRDYFSMFAFFNSIDESGTYSHFTKATPTPAELLTTPGIELQLKTVRAEIAKVESQLANIVRSATNAHQIWARRGKLTLPAPIVQLEFNSAKSNTTPDSVSTNVAKLEDDPVVRDGVIKFNGDNQVVIRSAKTFLRADPFSLDLKIKPSERQDRAVLLHQSKAAQDAGSRGFELSLEQGKPFFGLIHFWPGNALAVRAKKSLPLNQWAQLTVTYDGSSRASGVRLYLDGVPMETEIVRDRLTKDISYADEWKDRYTKQPPLTLAARFRDSGFKNGYMDSVRVFDVTLTASEVSMLATGVSPTNTFDHFIARVDEPCHIVLDEVRKLREQENQLLYSAPEIMVMQELPKPRVTHLLKRGAYDAPGEVVPRDTPDWLLAFPKGQPRDRLGLARWITDRKNPLTARVAVNRIWRMHFGRGLVASQEDFGVQGKLPTHPELLEWLAGWFMDNGWDFKALHELIVTSATFRQSNEVKQDVLDRDPENRLLTRAPKIRLPAEHIRDSALAASGLLNRKIGGPSVKPYQPEGLWEATGTGKSYKQDSGDKLYRRSLYTFWKRTAPPPSMLTFDAMSREVCTAKRDATATPLQSLVLLNDPQFVEASRVLGEKLLKQFPKDEASRNREAFRALTGRAPDKTEMKILSQLFNEQKNVFKFDTQDATKLLSIGESKSDKTLPPADAAAMTAMVNAIMNFDEFVVQR